VLALLAAHAVAAVSAPVLVRTLGRRAFLLLALVPTAAFAWALAWTDAVAAGNGPVEVVDWVPGLELSLDLELDTLSWLMTLIVGGVGALVLVYSAGYFSARATGLPRFAGVLVAFSGSMLGLVLADDLLLLYVFWELTTVTSYLLIGHYNERKASRRAAMQAIVVTTFGGLAMLVGLIIIGESAGTYRLSEVVASPPGGTTVTVAVALLLVGAATKSALVPFQFWLPAAMAAPTPVSAFLHAAAMVKAGVYLVARFAPAFADLPVWRWTVIVVGCWTLVHGAYRALRQYDLKLILAFGTVSQLGLLVVLVGAGQESAALAGLALLAAHAMFKAALFLVAGIVDATTGTRDIRRLGGLAGSLPVTATVGALATASMISLPPLAGFVGKEAAFDALLENSHTPLGALILVAVSVGSAMTVAYGLRFWWGAFGPADPHLDPEDQHQASHTAARPKALLVAPPALLAVLGVITAFATGTVERLLTPYAVGYPGETGHLVLWPGFTPLFALTAVITVGGFLLFLVRRPVSRLQRAAEVPVEADRVYRRTMRRLDAVALGVTGRTQRGSLPFYLGVIFIAFVSLVGWALAGHDGGVAARAWDAPPQVIAGALSALAAVLAARSRRRLKAVILAGVSGYGVALLFMLHGAPDLALTQVLVETVTLVVLVLVLRRLPAYFSVRPLTASRWVRLTIAVGVGLSVGALALIVPNTRVHEPVSVNFPEEGYVYGAGKNIVNVTLVDIRAWDTMGEISVVLVAATGVASLVFLRRRGDRIGRSPDASARGRVWADVVDPLAPPPSAETASRARPSWLQAGWTLAPQRRSIVFEIVTRLIFHSMIVVALFLLFAGHNAPGGGFAAGLVVGIALAVRYLAGGRYELGEAAPVHPGLLLGAGLLLSTAAGVAGLIAGGSVLQSWVVETTLPLFGEVKLVTSLFFDIGVFLLVIGLVLDVLRSLGAEIDRHAEDVDEDADADLLATGEGDRP
jgi:multicomponent Na+:H+ antiporter subunit A